MNKDGIIAIVEDDNLLALVISKHLEREGYATKSFVRAEDFLEFLSNNPIVNAVILDVKLKGEMNGITLSEKIPSVIPQIFCTGNSDVAQLSQNENTSIKAFLIKPIDLSQLSSLLKTL